MKKLTVTQAARYARVTPDTVRRWLRLGILPDRRLPGARKYIILDTDLLNPRQATTDLRVAA